MRGQAPKPGASWPGSEHRPHRAALRLGLRLRLPYCTPRFRAPVPPSPAAFPFRRAFFAGARSRAPRALPLPACCRAQAPCVRERGGLARTWACRFAPSARCALHADDDVDDDDTTHALCFMPHTRCCSCFLSRLCFCSVYDLPRPFRHTCARRRFSCCCRLLQYPAVTVVFLLLRLLYDRLCSHPETRASREQ